MDRKEIIKFAEETLKQHLIVTLVNEDTAKVLYCLHKGSEATRELISKATGVPLPKTYHVISHLQRDALVGKQPASIDTYALTDAGRIVTSYAYDTFLPLTLSGRFTGVSESSREFYRILNDRFQKIAKLIEKYKNQ